MICRLRTFRTLWGSWHSLVVRDPLLHCSGPCSRTSLFSSNLGFVTCSYICLFFSLCTGFGWGVGFVSVWTVTEGGSTPSCCQMSARALLCSCSLPEGRVCRLRTPHFDWNTCSQPFHCCCSGGSQFSPNDMGKDTCPPCARPELWTQVKDRCQFAGVCPKANPGCTVTVCL